MSSLIRWEPMAGLRHLREDMNRLMEDFLGETAEERAPIEMRRIPPVDVVDQTEKVIVRAEMPGIEKDNIQIEVSAEALQIRAVTKQEKEEKGENFYRRERHMGTYQRLVPLPAEVVPDQVKAIYKDGVLEVNLPKSEKAKVVQPVKVAVE